MTDAIRTKKEIQDLLEHFDEIDIYTRDPCVRSQNDSFASALRWVLKEEKTIKKFQEGT